MIIDEHTSIGDDAAGVSARAVRRWLWPRPCAVSIAADHVSLVGIASHEAAIATVERHLHGSHDVKAPADPLSSRPTEL